MKTIRRWCARGGLVVLVAACGVAPGRGAEPAANDSTAARHRLEEVHYGASFATARGLDVLGLTISARTPAFAGHPSLGLDLALPLEFYDYGVPDEGRLAADYLVLGGVLLPLMVVSEFCPSCCRGVNVAGVVLSPLLLPVVHPTLSWSPLRGAGVIVGYDAMYALSDAEKGVFFSPCGGVRLEPLRVLRIEGGIDRQFYWNWRGPSETLGWGWFVRVSLSSDLVGHPDWPPLPE